MSGPQAADVDPDSAAAGHYLHHLRKRVDNAPARVVRRRHDVAVVESELLVSTGGGKDSSGGHKLPSVEKPSKILIPLVGALTFNGGDATGHPLHHLFGIGFDRLRYVLRQAFKLRPILEFNRNPAAAARGRFVHL